MSYLIYSRIKTLYYIFILFVFDYIVYNTENVISLIAYIPSDQTHRRLLVFSTPFDEHTMCAFNEETAMVFSKNILEIYNIREHVHKDYEIQLNSFKFEEYFNIPIY